MLAWGALQRDFLLATRDVGVFGNPRLALVLRQQFKEEINGSMRPGGQLARLKFQNGIRKAQVAVGRNDIGVVGLDMQVVRHFAHREESDPGQRVGQRAFPCRVEMSRQHKGHAGVGRQMLEQRRERLQTAGRSSDASNEVPRRRSLPWKAGIFCQNG